MQLINILRKYALLFVSMCYQIIINTIYLTITFCCSNFCSYEHHHFLLQLQLQIFTQIYWWVWQWKNCENRPTFSSGNIFFPDTVYIYICVCVWIESKFIWLLKPVFIETAAECKLTGKSWPQWGKVDTDWQTSHVRLLPRCRRQTRHYHLHALQAFHSLDHEPLHTHIHPHTRTAGIPLHTYIQDKLGLFIFLQESLHCHSLNQLHNCIILLLNN